MTVGIEKVGQIAVPVADIDRAVAFYQDVLGLELLLRAPPERDSEGNLLALMSEIRA